jgi:hypothetical protein
MFIKTCGPKLVQPLRWAYAISCNENPLLPRNSRRGSEKNRGTRQSIWSDNSRTDFVRFTKFVCISNATAHDIRRASFHKQGCPLFDMSWILITQDRGTDA